MNDLFPAGEGRATIESVAKLAGVSVATVSRVLNNSENVRAKTAEKVRRAIQQLDYMPNQSARNLRRSESSVILTLAPNFSNPYYSKILTGIGDLAQSCGYSVLICNTNGDADNERQFLRMLETHRADGAIYLACHGRHEWLRQHAEQYPLVQCCEYVPELANPSVSIDNYAAAVETVRYLISMGHSRIAMLSADNDFISTSLRHRGYMDALKGAGIPYDPDLVGMASGDYSYGSGHLTARRLLTRKDRPTAVFCVSDILALSVISCANELGLRVPEDLSVTGIDDVDYTTMFHPYLTTVAQPCYEMGQESVRILLRMLSGGPEPPPRTFLPYRLVCRESAGQRMGP